MPVWLELDDVPVTLSLGIAASEGASSGLRTGSAPSLGNGKASEVSLSFGGAGRLGVAVEGMSGTLLVSSGNGLDSCFGAAAGDCCEPFAGEFWLGAAWAWLPVTAANQHPATIAIRKPDFMFVGPVSSKALL
jgi:hypothetical protein